MYRWETLYATTRKNLKTPIARDIWDDAWEGFSWFFDGPIWAAENPTKGPNVSIEVGDKKATVEMELAGYTKKDVSITVEDSTMTISGTRATANFVKTFRVDTERFDINSVKAGYKNGLLTVTMDRIRKPEINTEKRTVTIQ